MVKITQILSLTCLLIQLFSLNAVIIQDEVISNERLKQRIDTFNEWYSKNNPGSKVEARLTDNEFKRIGLFAKENINKNDVFFSVNRAKMFSHELIYKSKLGNFMTELEQQIGYSDINNYILFLIHEMSNPESEWKPYLDLLPRQPTGVLFDYWNRKESIEEELINTPILSKCLFKIKIKVKVKINMA